MKNNNNYVVLENVKDLYEFVEDYVTKFAVATIPYAENILNFATYITTNAKLFSVPLLFTKRGGGHKYFNADTDFNDILINDEDGIIQFIKPLHVKGTYKSISIVGDTSITYTFAIQPKDFPNMLFNIYVMKDVKIKELIVSKLFTNVSKRNPITAINTAVSHSIFSTPVIRIKYFDESQKKKYMRFGLSHVDIQEFSITKFNTHRYPVGYSDIVFTALATITQANIHLKISKTKERLKRALKLLKEKKIYYLSIKPDFIFISMFSKDSKITKLTSYEERIFRHNCIFAYVKTFNDSKILKNEILQDLVNDLNKRFKPYIEVNCEYIKKSIPVITMRFLPNNNAAKHIEINSQICFYKYSE